MITFFENVQRLVQRAMTDTLKGARIEIDITPLILVGGFVDIGVSSLLRTQRRLITTHLLTCQLGLSRNDPKKNRQ